MIRTSYIYPPVPSRNFDWCAWVDGHEEGAVTYGATQDEAIANLKERLEDDDLCVECGENPPIAGLKLCEDCAGERQ